MNDDTFRPAADDAEAMSAYLAGELSEAETAAFEQRLGADRVLAARLDALADALVVMRGYDQADVPAGFDERLDAHLAAQQPAGSAPADLAAHRERRDRSKLWLGIGTAAAVIAAGSVMAGSVLQGMGGMDVVSQGAARVESSSESAASAAGEDAAAESGPRAPVILDSNVALADEEALRRRYDGVPEAEGLIGVGIDEARRLERRFTQAVARRTSVPVPEAAPLAVQGGSEAAGGSSAGAGVAPDSRTDEENSSADEEDAPVKSAPPEDAAQAPAAPSAPAPGAKARRDRGDDSCLAAITADARGPTVPVRVESVRYAGRPAVVYVFVTSTPGATELDRTEVWVVRQSNCATLVFQQY